MFRTSRIGYSPASVASTNPGYVPFADLEMKANDLSLSTVYHETVGVIPVPGDEPGKWRPISLSGVRRKAQSL